jgi:predicted Zn finger-like uncharacterized protein
MLIVCPSCASRYSIDDAKIGAGRTVRCASCQHAWFVTLEDAADNEKSPADTARATPENGLDQDMLDRLFAEQMASAAGEAAAAGIDPKPTPETRKGFFAFFRRKPKKPKASKSRPAARSKPKPTPRPDAGVIGQRPASAARFGPGARSAALGLVGASLAAALILWREPVVRALPATAPVYAAVGLAVNPVGIDFTSVRSRVAQQTEGRVLTVEGQITSQAATDRPVPPIEVLIRAENRQIIYRWTTEPPRPVVKPGETLQFRARLATPPEAGQTVEVRFAPPARTS